MPPEFSGSTLCVAFTCICMPNHNLVLCPLPCPLPSQIAEDNFGEVAAAVLAAYDSGDLAKALEVEGGFKKWANALGKAQKRKGKRLFMPLRIALTVSWR